jgi:hypothetical protein
MYIPRPPPSPRADADSAVAVSTLPHGLEPEKPVTGTHGVHQTSDDGVSHHPDHLGAPPPSPRAQTHDRDNAHSQPLHQEISNPTPNLSLLPRDTSPENNNQNITIGATVGVLLAAFLAAFFYFVYRYHHSIRIRRRDGAGRNSIASFTFGTGYGSSLKGSQSRSSRGSRGSSARYWHGRGPAVAGGAGGG